MPWAPPGVSFKKRGSAPSKNAGPAFKGTAARWGVAGQKGSSWLLLFHEAS